VPVVDMILIALAGVGAGAINAVVGSGTLITFPTLVSLGYPPVTSTMSNAVGLVAGSASGTWGYRRELRGQWNRLAWQIPASLAGAGLGAWLLLHLPERVFEQVVPVLLIAALILVVVGPKNLLSLLVNIVAAVAYTVVAFDRISWVAAGLIAAGSLIGGFLGAHYGRRLSPNALRAVIVVVGLIGLYRLLTV
jgi:uncharacterized membrane protein YfcA